MFNSKQLELELEGGVKEVFDDNVTLTKKHKKSDFITDLTGALRARYEGKRQNLELVGRSTEHLYARNWSYTNNAQDVFLDYNLELTARDQIKIKDAGSHYEDPRSFEEAFGRAGGRYGTVRNKLDGDYLHDFSKQLQTDIGYSNQSFIFTKDKGGNRNSLSNQARANGAYLWNSETQFSLWYNYEDRHYDGIKGTGWVQGITGGVRRYLTKQLYLDLQGGLDLIRTFGKDLLARPVLVAALTGELTERTQASLSFMRRDQTSGYETDIFNFWQVSANLKHEITRRFQAVLSAFYGHGRYRSLDIKDNFIGWNGSLDYEFWRNVKAGLAYAFYLLDSNVSSREYARNQVSLKFTVTF